MASIGLGGHVLHNVLLQVSLEQIRAHSKLSLDSDQGSDVVMDYQERFLPLPWDLKYGHSLLDLAEGSRAKKKLMGGLIDSAANSR